MQSDASADPHGLARFVAAQSESYDRALAEIRSGRKSSHWMWYVFPQLTSLGRSAMAQRYAIKTMAEADAYLRHPLLGPRLIECASALLRLDGRSAEEIFGFPDVLKLQSSATLFAAVAAEGSVFAKVLDKYFEGARDEQTIRLLAAEAGEE